MAKLGPDIITEEINIDDDDPSTDAEGSPGACDSVRCQELMKDLRDQIISVQEEKKTLAIELENLRSNFAEVNKVKEENAVLTAEVHKQQKVLEKCNRVSVLAVEEYEELQVNLELEKDLRKTAESFAQEMFIEQNKLKRQSQLLLQNVGPDEQLLKALDENAKLSQMLEEERLQHRQKVEEWEKQLVNEVLHKEIKSLKQQLELLEEDKKELEEKFQTAEEKVKNLKHSVDELQKRIHQSEDPVPPPPPPPPPPPLLPPPNPIRSLMSMIRKKSHPNSSMTKKEKTPHQETDLKRQAVEEMMDRIKKGVHLRPVNQTNRSKAKETLNTSASSRSLKSLETDSSETELERILRLRKVTTDQDSSSAVGILATSESKSMPVLGSAGSQSELNKKPLVAELRMGSSESDQRSPSDVVLTNKAAGTEKQTESMVVLDPESTEDQMSGHLDKDKMMEEKDQHVHKDTSVGKTKETDSSHC
ncbi:hypothetical protein lerEdw1_007803 [Lerista edwardsae]|nr:hypothetical protein lerEdw1_007803 [Lerista edwardsae]